MLKKVLTVVLLLIILFVTGSSRAESKSQCTVKEAWANLPVPRIGIRKEGLMPQASWMLNFVWCLPTYCWMKELEVDWNE